MTIIAGCPTGSRGLNWPVVLAARGVKYPRLGRCRELGDDDEFLQIVHAAYLDGVELASISVLRCPPALLPNQKFTQAIQAVPRLPNITSSGSLVL